MNLLDAYFVIFNLKTVHDGKKPVKYMFCGFFTANLLKKGTFEFCSVPFTTYNNTHNLQISQSAVQF